MSIRLVLADSDVLYIEKLGAWIIKHMPYQFSIEIVTKQENLQAWVDNGGKADLIAISPTLVTDECSRMKNVVLLDDGSHPQISEQMARINKFKPAEDLVKDFLTLCADKLPVIMNRFDLKQRMTLVLYSDGLDVINPVAPIISFMIARKNLKVFYLSLEQIQTSDFYFSTNNNKGFTEMLYYIKSNKENLSMRLDACCSKDVESGINFLKSPSGLFKFEDMDQRDLDSLIAAIRERNLYDELVVAMDLNFDEKFIQALALADRIIFTTSNMPGSFFKLKKIMEEIQKQLSETNVMAKSRIILTKLCDNSAFNDEFPEIEKYYINPNTNVSKRFNYLPSENDIQIYEQVLNDFEEKEKRK